MPTTATKTVTDTNGQEMHRDNSDYGGGSLWPHPVLRTIPPDVPLWLVSYNDNSDYGTADLFFLTAEEAWKHAALLEAKPREERGNIQHPAPQNVDVAVYAITRLK